MSDEELAPEVMEAALGLTNKRRGFPIYGAWMWIGENEGPHDGVHLHLYVTRRVRARGGDITAGSAVHLELRREFQTGRLKAFGVSPDGSRINIPASIWAGYGPATDDLWELATYRDPADSTREYRVFVSSRPDWWPGEQDLTTWCSDGSRADKAARESLKARRRSPTDMAICKELSAMWAETGSSIKGDWKTIQTLRARMRRK
ncbi:MAG: hypothetical protein JNL41_05445 [Phenylobacterium sp.]|uniref:hypothetical protein n=1 Tax=Phenylobacterium sp. TaxID=1871053 RepID=UPI001A620803|nr:hypothetical protein [Phenylobacterium sp.]MBL8553701.1 hypothetical protein [Phenylobacterium sp.]